MNTEHQPTIAELAAQRDQAESELAAASRDVSEASARAARARKQLRQIREQLASAREAEWARRARQ